MEMGRGESKTFGLRIRALRDLENLHVTAESEQIPPGQIELFGIEEVDVSNEAAGKSNLIGKKLIPWRSVDLAAGEEAEVWVRVTTTPADRGRLAAELALRARGAGRSTIDLRLNVRPVRCRGPTSSATRPSIRSWGCPAAGTPGRTLE